jgi:hypothetical protein
VLADLSIALGIPLVLGTISLWLYDRHREHLPRWLQRLSSRQARLWNIGVGLIIFLSLLRYLLSH